MCQLSFSCLVTCELATIDENKSQAAQVWNSRERRVLIESFLFENTRRGSSAIRGGYQIATTKIDNFLIFLLGEGFYSFLPCPSDSFLPNQRRSWNRPHRVQKPTSTCKARKLNVIPISGFQQQISKSQMPGSYFYCQYFLKSVKRTCLHTGPLTYHAVLQGLVNLSEDLLPTGTLSNVLACSFTRLISVIHRWHCEVLVQTSNRLRVRSRLYPETLLE